MSDLDRKTFPYVLREELREIEQSRDERQLTAGGALKKVNGESAANPGDAGSAAKSPEPPPQAKVAGDGADTSIYEEAAAKNLCGLAFSGGGIRSATFNLGVLQTLARYGLLSRIDYLSTVSGGGYIGSWLTTWLRRSGWKQVNEGLATTNYDPNQAEPSAIGNLRKFSNYLTPKTGVFSADTWTAVAIYLRNVTLNLTILAAALAAVLILPKIVSFATENSETWLTNRALLVLGIGSTVVAIGVIVTNFLAMSSRAKSRSGTNQKSGYFVASQHEIQWLVIVPLFITAWALMAAVIRNPESWSSFVDAAKPGALVLVVVLLFSFVNIVGSLFRAGRVYLGRVSDLLVQLGAVAVGGAVAAGALWLAFPYLREGPQWMITEYVDILTPAQAKVVWGPPLLIGIFLLAGTFYIGIMRHRLDTAHREWWGRLGAWLMIYSAGWIGLFLVSLGSTELVTVVTETFGPWINAALGSGWLVTTVGGLLAARSPATGGKRSSPAAELFARAAPYVFVVGLIVLLTTLVDYAGGASRSGWTDEPFVMFVAVAGLVAASLVLSWRVDINQFSMYNFYRNRLVRCYVGASDEDRNPHPFTGFDWDEHNVRISDLLVQREEDPSNAKRPDGFQYGEEHYVGPYHIVNTTLNLVSGKKLAWQKRRARSLVFTPLYTGFDTRDYRPTAHFNGGMSLGAAVTISGAAASPNMGYHTSAPLAFLMTVFNVRLGYWLGNPKRDKTWQKRGPGLGLRYLFLELFALTDEDRGFVYVSDGGHFENLGIYELVRRRCQYIIACDAEQDVDFSFDGLGNAIEKCRTDFGVDIEIDTDLVRKTEETGYCGRHCAVGRILYRDAPPGTLLYIKASMTGDEPTDVERYATQQKSFPHQSTGDQWFDETQFESYRKLGEHICDSVLKPLGTKKEVSRLETEQLFVQLKQHWYAPTKAAPGAFSKHAAQLDRIFNEIRKTRELRFLDTQVYPEWRQLISAPEIPQKADVPTDGRWLPPTYPEVRAGFYICQQVIQLMESVYHDLNLETECEHPDNRGWENFFRHWSWSGMFRIAWAISASTYGARFQEFCRRRLDLSVGEVNLGVRRQVSDIVAGQADAWQDLEDNLVLNFFEIHLLKKLTAPGSKRDGFEIVPLQLSVLSPEKDKEIRFTFGFALTEGNRLHFFRVQDHVREMGLGRKALLKIVAAGSHELFMDQLPEGEDFPTEDQKRRFERMFDSVLIESGMRPPPKARAANPE